MSEEDLASKISGETPWWAKAPVWLAAGIVGVPSLIAIGAGFFVASNVTKGLGTLTTYNLSELHMLNEQNIETERDFKVIEKFMADDLKAQYQTCIAASKTPEQRTRCISPEAREDKYGIKRDVADPPGAGTRSVTTPPPR